MRAVLTRAVIRFVHRGTYCGTERISHLEEPTLVYTYRGPNPPFAQVTPFGTVLWNLTYMDRLSPLARRVVLRHECSHRDRNRLFRFVWAGTMGFFGVGLLFVLTAARLVAQNGASADGVLSGLVGLGLVAAAVLVARLEELLADYHALCDVGEARFLAAYDEIDAAVPAAGAGRLVSRLVYTRPRTTVRLHRYVGRLPPHSPVRALYSYLTGSSRTPSR